MQSPIAVETPHRTRLVWVSAALVASVIGFALMRPAHARHHHHHHLPFIGQCGEHQHAHSYRVYY